MTRVELLDALTAERFALAPRQRGERPRPLEPVARLEAEQAARCAELLKALR